LVEEEKEDGDADESMESPMLRRKLESLQGSEVTNPNQTEETKQVYQEVVRESEIEGFASKKKAVPLIQRTASHNPQLSSMKKENNINERTTL